MPSERTEDLHRLLCAYQPADAAEQAFKQRMLQFIGDTDPMSAERLFAGDHYLPGHFTASAFVLSPDKASVLLIFHSKLQRWLQPGGHVEIDDVSVESAARREVAEETGVVDPETQPALFDIDIHEIPARGERPAHLHFDLRFLCRAPTLEMAAGSDAHDARWVRLEEVQLAESDVSVMRAIAKLRANESNAGQGGQAKSLCVTTLGCRLNQAESDSLQLRAQAAGYRVTTPEQADVHVVNTCCITAAADSDSRAAARKAKRANPNAEVMMTGCWATLSPQQATELPGVSRVVHNRDKDTLFALPDAQQGSSDATASAPRSRAYLKIQDGCDLRCSFCIVPKVRGPSTSIALDRLLPELDRLVASGYPEIVLTGVHLGTYGRDIGGDTSAHQRLPDLIRALLPRLQGARLRLGSLDPHEVSPELIDLLDEHRDTVCSYLHLPVQSGCDMVLADMRRAHRAADLRQAIDTLVARIPDICIGTDVITGFPTENAESFDSTRQLLESLPLAYMHVFSYSPRDGTVAADMCDKVPKAEKKRRTSVLRALSDQHNKRFSAQHLGTSRDAVVLRQPNRHSGRWVALTDNYLRVELLDPTPPVGARTMVHIESMDGVIAVGRSAT